MKRKELCYLLICMMLCQPLHASATEVREENPVTAEVQEENRKTGAEESGAVLDEAEAGKCADKNASTTCFVEGDKLLIDLGEERNVSSFHYLPDQSEYNKGLIAGYRLSVGMEADAVNRVVSSGEFSNIKNNPILQSVYFSPVTARYVLLEAVKMVEDGAPMGFAELGIQ